MPTYFGPEGAFEFAGAVNGGVLDGGGGGAVDEGAGLPVTVFGSMISTRVPSGS